jgi:integrase
VGRRSHLCGDLVRLRVRGLVSTRSALRFHDLRHSAANLALAAGANTRELMERMGHTSAQVALRYLSLAWLSRRVVPSDHRSRQEALGPTHVGSLP